MAKRKQADPPLVETKDVNGHRIECRKIKDFEEVTIDGEPVAFFRVGKSYSLELDAYSPEQPTLLDAAQAYAKRLPARKS